MEEETNLTSTREFGPKNSVGFVADDSCHHVLKKPQGRFPIKQKSLPNLLSSAIHLSSNCTILERDRSPTLYRRSPTVKNLLGDHTSWSKASVFSTSPDGKRSTPSRQRSSRKFLYSLAVMIMKSRRSSINLSRVRPDSCNKTSHAIILGQSIKSKTGAQHNVPHLRRRSLVTTSLTQKEPKCVIMWRKVRLWTTIIFVLSKLLKKHAASVMKDTSSLFYSHNNHLEDESESGIDRNHYMFFDPSYYKANRQMRMSNEAVRILTKPHDCRTTEEINFVMTGLRGIPAIAELPIRMQRLIAQFGCFERYEPKRMIIKQGQRPEGFYFIIYGKVVVVVKNEVTGVTNIVCDMQRGESFGELAIMNRTTRTSSVVTKTYVELIKLSDDEYVNIFMVGGCKNLNDPDQYQFLRSIQFLRDWPVQKLFDSPDPKNVTFGYFKRNAVIAKDSNLSDWLIVVKTGSLAVLKKLVKVKATVSRSTGRYIHTAHSSPYFNFLHKTPDSAKQRNDSSKAQPTASSDNDVDKENKKSDVSDHKVSYVMEKTHAVHHGLRPHTTFNKQRQGVFRLRNAKSAIDQKSRRTLTSILKKPTASQEKVHFELETSTETVQGEGRLKHKRTYLDELDARYNASAHTLTEADINPQFVFVQTLTKGDVFGLAPLLFPDQPSLCLVSNGADCLMINKKYYLDNCTQALIRRLKIQVSPYPSDKKLQLDLLDRINWDVYKETVRREVYGHKRVPVIC